MMKKRIWKRIAAGILTAGMLISLCACGGGKTKLNNGAFQEVDPSELQFPLKKNATLKGMISYPANTESDPNKRTIFKRLEKQTNVHIDWTAIQSDQWNDKISLAMANPKKLSDFVFDANFSDSDLLKYARQGIIISLEKYIDAYMPNLKAIFDKYPEYKTMCLDSEGHIWALPWIEQEGSGKKAIQTVGNMGFINKKWLDFLKLDVPQTTDEFEKVLVAFRDHAAELKKQFNVEGDIIPMSCIVNGDPNDPFILINGFGEGYADADLGRHIAVTDEKKVICSGTQEGFKKGITWLHSLYEQGLIDPEAFTQEWSTYVSKGKFGRYGVCFSWDVANIANINDYIPVPALEADVKIITPQNGSFTSGFNRGRCVVTAVAQNPALVCAWLDQMYAPLQSPQNNWGTYGEDDDFDIFELSKNADGGDMLKHAALGNESPVEVREAECVGGPLAVLDEYYGKYVTLPDDAAYRLKWIEDNYTPYMTRKYVYPAVLMEQDDLKALSNYQTDVTKLINSKKSDWIMNGLTDSDWNQYLKDLDAYGLQDMLSIYQKYLDSYPEEMLLAK